MKKIVTLALAVLAAAMAYSAEMASQKWVKMKLQEMLDGSGVSEAVSNAVGRIIDPYVADAVSNSLAVTKAISPMAVDAGTNGTIFAFFEPASVQTLVATNSANMTITNGTLFAWAGNGVYTNAQIADELRLELRPVCRDERNRHVHLAGRVRRDWDLYYADAGGSADRGGIKWIRRG